MKDCVTADHLKGTYRLFVHRNTSCFAALQDPDEHRDIAMLTLAVHQLCCLHRLRSMWFPLHRVIKETD
jgi:hypothetical protein